LETEKNKLIHLLQKKQKSIDNIKISTINDDDNDDQPVIINNNKKDDDNDNDKSKVSFKTALSSKKSSKKTKSKKSNVIINNNNDRRDDDNNDNGSGILITEGEGLNKNIKLEEIITPIPNNDEKINLVPKPKRDYKKKLYDIAQNTGKMYNNVKNGTGKILGGLKNTIGSGLGSIFTISEGIGDSLGKGLVASTDIYSKFGDVTGNQLNNLSKNIGTTAETINVGIRNTTDKMGPLVKGNIIKSLEAADKVGNLGSNLYEQVTIPVAKTTGNIALGLTSLGTRAIGGMIEGTGNVVGCINNQLEQNKIRNYNNQIENHNLEGISVDDIYNNFYNLDDHRRKLLFNASNDLIR